MVSGVLISWETSFLRVPDLRNSLERPDRLPFESRAVIFAIIIIISDMRKIQLRWHSLKTDLRSGQLDYWSQIVEVSAPLTSQACTIGLLITNCWGFSSLDFNLDHLNIACKPDNISFQWNRIIVRKGVLCREPKKSDVCASIQTYFLLRAHFCGPLPDSVLRVICLRRWFLVVSNRDRAWRIDFYLWFWSELTRYYGRKLILCNPSWRHSYMMDLSRVCTESMDFVTLGVQNRQQFWLSQKGL